jgi:hypothetical protein
MFGRRWSTTCRVMVRVLRSGETVIASFHNLAFQFFG